MSHKRILCVLLFDMRSTSHVHQKDSEQHDYGSCLVANLAAEADERKERTAARAARRPQLRFRL